MITLQQPPTAVNGSHAEMAEGSSVKAATVTSARKVDAPPGSVNRDGYTGFGGYGSAKWLRCWRLAVTASTLGQKLVSGTAGTAR